MLATATLRHHDVIERAMNFPMEGVVERYAKEEELPLEAAREHERELKRYLALCALNPATDYGMKGQIDELWHTFIIFTKRYAQFCNEVAGRFLHHTPAGREDDLAKNYEVFLRDYEATFGEPAPVHLWPRLTSHDDGAHINCSKGCQGDCSGTGCSKGCSVSCS